MYFKKMLGERCCLSPLNPQDYEIYTRWVNDIDVSLGVTFASVLVTPEQEKEILEKLSQAEYNFAIVELKKDELIGNIGFTHIDYINRTAEMGIFIGNKNYWGKGYGVEAIELLLDFGFNILNLHNINLKVFSYNKPAIKCYQKVGFKEVGRLRETKQIAGQKFDHIIMDILENEYKSKLIKDLVDKRNQ
jgi:RimJ/RimL family protein N-acetyltransferase